MYYGIIKARDVANGPGVRVSLFVSGCRNHCPGCFNQGTWNFHYGREFVWDTDMAKIESLVEPYYVAGFSVLGGDPMETENLETVTAICKQLKEKFPNKTIWVYTGYRYEDYAKTPLMQYIDVLVDGPFVQALADPSLVFRGSSNQRIIDVKATRDSKNVVTLPEFMNHGLRNTPKL